MILRDIFLWPIRIFMHLIFRIQVTGAENVPETGGCIIAANHISFWDPVFIACFLNKRRICFLAKAELFKFAPFGFVLKHLGAVPVARGTRDAGTLMHAIKHLKQGNVIGIFPEGTRARGGKKPRAKRGTVKMAVSSGSPVVPVHLSATYRIFSKIKMTVGKPVYYKNGLTDEDILNESGALLEQIYAL